MTDGYVLLSVSSIHQALEELGIPYSKKTAIAVLETPTGYIRRVADVAIYASKSRKLLLVPADRAQGHENPEGLSLPVQQKRFYYFLIQARKNGDEALAKRFKEDARSLLPAAVWAWGITAIALGEARDTEVDVRGQRGLVPLRMEGYLLLPAGAETVARARMGAALGPPASLILDADDLYILCQGKLNIMYLQEELKATARSAVLLVIARQGERTVGVRATRLAWGAGKKQKIHGIYACSSGFGAHIQAYTEELLRTNLLPMLAQGSREGYASSTYGTRPRSRASPTDLPPFTLHAIPSAAPIWKSAFGFQDTQQKKGQLALLTKAIAPGSQEDRAPASTTTRKRRASKSASPASVSKYTGPKM